MARSVAARLVTGRPCCSASAHSSSTASKACMLVSGRALGSCGASLTWGPAEYGHTKYRVKAGMLQCPASWGQAHGFDRHEAWQALEHGRGSRQTAAMVAMLSIAVSLSRLHRSTLAMQLSA